MDNIKNDRYYVGKIITDLRLIQVSENSDKLTEAFKKQYSAIPWRAIKGLRNRIVHEYGNVNLSVVYDTVFEDIPALLRDLEGIV